MTGPTPRRRPGRLDLHIGVEKTGSSTLQAFFDRNRAALLERGVLYPRSVGRRNHTALAVVGRDDDTADDLRRRPGLDGPAAVRAFRREKADELRAEIAAAAADRVVLSSEHCSSRLLEQDEVDRLRDWLTALVPSAELHVHVYLRRQDAMHESRYSTVVRMGGTEPLGLPSEEEYRHLYDFDALLDRWATSVGERNVHPRRFERSRLVGGDVVHDLAAALAVDVSDLPAADQPANAALDQPTQEFLRHLNRHVPRLAADGRTAPARAALLRAVDAAATVGSPAGLRDEQAAAVLSRVAASNAEVARRWFGGEELFRPRAARTVEHRELDVERAAALAGAALLAAAADTEAAAARVAALEERVSALRDTDAERRSRIEKLEDEREVLRDRLDAVRSSRAYRLARTLGDRLRPGR